MPAGFMSLRRPPAGEPNLAAPRSFEGTITDRGAAAQDVIQDIPPPASQVYGPKTKAERNIEAMQAYQQQQELQRQDYLWKKEVDDAYSPTKFVGIDSPYVMDPSTGTVKPTGIVKPEKLTDARQALNDRMALDGVPDTPENRALTRAKMEREHADNVRNPMVDEMRMFQREQSRQTRLDKLDAQEQSRQDKVSNWYKNDYDVMIRPVMKSVPIIKALDSAANSHSRGGDFMMLYSLVQIADPESVVRDSELQLLRSLLSEMAILTEGWKKWTADAEALSDEARQAAKDGANIGLIRSQALLNSANSRYEALAKRGNIDPGLLGMMDLDPRTKTLNPRQYPEWSPRASYGVRGPHVTQTNETPAENSSLGAELMRLFNAAESKKNK
jgi:hypothetical protein